MTSIYRTPASVNEIEAARRLPVLYTFSELLNCPMCGTNNAVVDDAATHRAQYANKDAVVYTYHTMRRWRPRRWFRSIGYHRCKCCICGAKWRELPRGRET